jgi:hypothetical protein
MARIDTQNSSMPKMLMDPGKLYVDTILGLQLMGIPDLVICALLTHLVPNMISSTVPEDRPESLEEFKKSLSAHIAEVVKTTPKISFDEEEAS